ncbi:hypothetical protein [Sulfolobus spindle-shaped virus SSV19]|nr:hypothetical protein [Sulfolobus spindle-shaped virus SSV19]
MYLSYGGSSSRNVLTKKCISSSPTISYLGLGVSILPPLFYFYSTLIFKLYSSILLLFNIFFLTINIL